MQIGDRVQISEAKHPFHTFCGTIIGFRGKRAPDDTWLLLYIDNRGRSYLVPQSMVRLLPDEGYGSKRFGPYIREQS